MPELPEIEALADHLRRNAVGLTIGRIDVSAFSVLKTFDPAISVPYVQSLAPAPQGSKPVDYAAEHQLEFWSRFP